MGASFVDHIPLTIGTPEEFARIAKALQDAHFDEETLCRTLKLKTMSDLGAVQDVDVDFSNVSPQLQILIRLFLSLSLVACADVERVFDRSTLDAFLSLGILGTGEFGQDEFYARTLLYPAAGFLIVSDRHSTPEDKQFDPPPDIVFPALYEGTLRFVRLLPSGDAQDALDLCAGTGIAALALSRTNKLAVAADITERATQFALFNRALNKCENVEVVRGDLYDAVAGRTFDRIVAHPPYVPSVGLKTIWRDGGTTGELLVTRIIEGLPEHLRKGGLFCCLTQGLDTEEARFEERVRGWLKESGDQFDVLFAYEKERTPQRVLDILGSRDALLGTIQELQAEFERAKVVKLPYGALFIRRLSDSAGLKPWTMRKKLSAETEGSDVEGAFAQHDRLSAPEFERDLAKATPQLAPRLEVKVTYVVHEGSLAPAEYVFETDKPFSLRVEFDDWAVPLMMGFNGTATVAEVYQNAQSQAELPDDFKLKDFIVLVSRAIEGGLLVLPDNTVADLANQ